MDELRIAFLPIVGLVSALVAFVVEWLETRRP